MSGKTKNNFIFFIIPFLLGILLCFLKETFIIWVALTSIFWVFTFIGLSSKIIDNIKFNKNEEYRELKMTIRRFLFILLLAYPILVIISCNWNEAFWITWCAIPFLNNSFSEVLYLWYVFSFFTLWLPIFVYIFFVLVFSELLVYIIVKILKNFKKEENKKDEI